jgi:hypothetical protein
VQNPYGICQILKYRHEWDIQSLAEDRRFIYAGFGISEIKEINLRKELDRSVCLSYALGLSHPAVLFK